MTPSTPAESRHQLALEMLKQDDAGLEDILSKFTSLTSQLLGVPGSFVSVLDDQHQYIRGAQQFALEQTSLEDALCRHTASCGTVLVCQDTLQDERFADHPLILAAPYIRFYAGAPLRTRDGAVIGTLCVADTRPHEFSQKQVELLELLAAIMTAWLDAWYSSDYRDVVTLLPNRQKLMRDIEQLETLSVEAPHSLVLIDCIDMPRAYEISRSLGMATMESILKGMTSLLRERLKLSEEEVLYSIATGRFALLTSVKSPLWLKRLSERLGNVHAQLHENISIDLAIRLGEVSFNPTQCPAPEVLRRSVSALHEAIGQNKAFLSYDAQIDSRRNLDFRLMHDLAAALRSSSGLYLVYQPQVSLHSGTPVGLEALIRWEHPELGNLPPAGFLPLVEKTSLMAEVTDWVILTVLAQLKKWVAKGLLLPVSVNVSVSDFARPGFADWLEKKMVQAGLPVKLLRIECLETEKVLESPLAMAGLNLLKRRGFNLSLDDFGSGYSNINYLQRIPVDVIKLDRSLIYKLATDDASRTIARHVITMLKELNYVVLAEGVEDEQTLLALRQFGCDEVQGFFCSRPLLPEGVEQWLNGQSKPAG
ncbi:sensor domain-containing phosphodiesterase [Erwinia pyri]|uniref:Sensor domain-containing phosphodiesterase n=1 Tax=Erwinia pyri TaxID=3062598 RepID=A0AA50DMN8_9GAMM|nr:sensor domain-containing phosphodiesterase [Erwinia sp. DE2]WLS80754.1 sensor domain-containing phosphodiesterase [Erwinia sp. DE2]